MKIQAIIPTCNASRWLNEAIISIVFHPDTEVVVVDDGSEQNELRRTEDICARHERVKFYKQQKIGLPAVLNFAISISNEPFVMRLDADDISLPKRIEQQLAYLESHPDVAVVGGQIILIDEMGKSLPHKKKLPIEHSSILKLLRRGKSPFMHPSVMMRRDAILSVGGYRSVIKYSEDYDLWLRLSESNFKFANLSEPVIKYRRHANQLTRLNNRQRHFYKDLATISSESRKKSGIDVLDGIEDFISIDEFKKFDHFDISNLSRIYTIAEKRDIPSSITAEDVQFLRNAFRRNLFGASSKSQSRIALILAKICWKNGKFKLFIKLMLLAFKNNPVVSSREMFNL